MMVKGLLAAFESSLLRWGPALGLCLMLSSYAEAAAPTGGTAPETAVGPDLEMAPQVPLAATLTFQAAADTDAERLFLGNIASCSGMHQICDEAYAVDLGPSPEPGRSVSWHTERVRSLLAKEWPGADIRLAGAKVVKVTSAATQLTEERVFSALKTLLTDSFAPDDALTVSVDRVMVPTGLKLRPGDYALEFPELSPEHLSDPDWVLRNLSGNQRLTIHCHQQDSEDTALTFAISAHLTARALLPVTAHALRKGDELTAEDLTTSAVTLNRGATPYIAKHAELIGKRLRHAVAAGMPLQASDVEIPRLVRRGQMVTLKVNDGEVAVTGQVKMLGDGVPGQIVEAQYPATKKKLRVRVVDANTVQYVF